MRIALAMLMVILVSGISACADESAEVEAAGAAGAGPRQSAADELPLLVVHKSPACGCCSAWVEHMRSAGFRVEVRDTDDLGAIKAEVDLPYGLGSCHTARVGDYFVEGHVPAEDVKRLLAEKPEARGLAVPGMPVGSPGMEQGDAREPYGVLLVAKDGSTTVFAHHGD